jgi:hypothetical protein
MRITQWAASAAVLAALATPAWAADWKPPHMADGKPDLNGTWTNSSLTRLERDPKLGERLVLTPAETAKLEGDNKAYNTMRNQPTRPDQKIDEIPCSPGFVGSNCGYNQGWTDPGETVMRVRGEPRSSFITSPANGRVPAVRPEAQARMAARGVTPVARSQADALKAGELAGRPGQNDNPEGRSLAERCISMGQPLMQPGLYNNNYQITQSKDAVAIEQEMIHDTRIVRLNAKHRTDGARPWFGDPIGWYEGDTLVVETTNYSSKQNLRGASENLTLTERFTRVGPDRIRYQFKVEDPTTWDTAWSGEYEFGKAKGIVYEYACHEGNYALEGILAGARAEEEQARAARK